MVSKYMENLEDVAAFLVLRVQRWAWRLLLLVRFHHLLLLFLLGLLRITLPFLLFVFVRKEIPSCLLVGLSRAACRAACLILFLQNVLHQLLSLPSFPLRIVFLLFLFNFLFLFSFLLHNCRLRILELAFSNELLMHVCLGHGGAVGDPV